MKFLDLSLPTPAENLALDEALLEAAEAGEGESEVLRLWESPQPAVVLGRSSRVACEVRSENCQLHGVSILRRASGGAAVIIGPGCLMYAVVLSYERRPELHSLDAAHAFVLERTLGAVLSAVPSAVRMGTSDLAFQELGGVEYRKFSGNSLRCKRTHLLYHGTLLYNGPLSLAQLCLGDAPRQPAYRQRRDHAAFMGNLPLTGAQLRERIRAAWQPEGVLTLWPQTRVEELLQERYSQAAWNLGR